MAVTGSDLVVYGSVNRPQDDVSTAGGAIDTASRPLDTQFTGSSVVVLESDGADTRGVWIEGRIPAGDVQVESVTLDGTTPVSGSTSFERLLRVTMSAADGSRTVTLTEGNTVADSGPSRHVFNPDETDAFILFQRATSETSAKKLYEKVFYRNNNTGSNFISSSVKLDADPQSKLQIALEDQVDGTATVSDRETLPTATESNGFVDDDVFVGVPGNQLNSGSAIGVWYELSLGALDSPVKSTGTIQIVGEST